MLRICICDDSEDDIEYCKNMIFHELNPEEVKLSVYRSGEALLFNSHSNINMFDVIFMDIEMAHTNGIETARKMRENGYSGDIVYLTAVSDYVFDSFDTRPLNYLVKQSNHVEKLRQVLQTAVENAQKRNECYMFISNNGETYRINKNQIVFVESEGRKINIVMEDGQKYSCYSTMADMLKNLSEECYLRVHKSYIVNCYYIKRLHHNVLVVQNNIEISIGRSYIKQIQDLLAQIFGSLANLPVRSFSDILGTNVRIFFAQQYSSVSS